MTGKPVKSSPIWNYFSYEGTGKHVSCKLCVNGKQISLGGDLPRNQTLYKLKKHLETMERS